jgi:glutathione peroxidase
LEGLSFLIYDFFLNNLRKCEVDFSGYKGNVLLIVNVASHCGFTTQYKDLQKLYDQLSDKNFSVLAFPCNDFFNQEPGSVRDVLEFCEGGYGVTFDMFEKVKVRGVAAHPLYKYLETEFLPVIRPRGFSSSLFNFFTHIYFWLKEHRFPHAGEVVWNFHKFVIGRNGQVVGHFSSDCDPFDPRLVACIEREL